MRIPIGLSSLMVAIALIAILTVGRDTTLSPSHAGSPVVQAIIVDGDTIELGGRIVQLYGIDAPELGQRCYHDGLWTHCGLDAAFALNKLIGIENVEVNCTPAETDGRDTDQVCLVGSVDVAHVLLEDGYVVVASETSVGYREAENLARQGSLGLWHSEFVPPSEWRGGRRLPGESEHEIETCPIKAVISDDGDHFYYVPTDSNYLSVTVDLSKGERFFCSDEQARQAGWRRKGQIAVEGSAG